MRKTLSVKYLNSIDACQEAIDAFEAQSERRTDKILDLLVKSDKLDLLVKSDKLDWCLWLLPRLMARKQRVQYAIFAARQVLNIFESRCPDDSRPRKAIEAAERCVAAGFRRADVAHAAAYADAAADAAYAAGAAHAAHVAADAADAAYAAGAAHAAHVAAYAAYAAYAVANAGAKMELKIIAYGRGLLKEGGAIKSSKKN